MKIDEEKLKRICEFPDISWESKWLNCHKILRDDNPTEDLCSVRWKLEALMKIYMLQLLGLQDNPKKDKIWSFMEQRYYTQSMTHIDWDIKYKFLTELTELIT